MADEQALQALSCYYGHVGGATEFFEAMKSEEEENVVMGHYFASHPEAVQRIDNLHRLTRELHLGVEDVLTLSAVLDNGR